MEDLQLLWNWTEFCYYKNLKENNYNVSFLILKVFLN
jgi:hypothetical protein